MGLLDRIIEEAKDRPQKPVPPPSRAAKTSLREGQRRASEAANGHYKSPMDLDEATFTHGRAFVCVLKVPCPKCNAAAGMPCFFRYIGSDHAAHKARVRDMWISLGHDPDAKHPYPYFRWPDADTFPMWGVFRRGSSGAHAKSPRKLAKSYKRGQFDVKQFEKKGGQYDVIPVKLSLEAEQHPKQFPAEDPKNWIRRDDLN